MRTVRLAFSSEDKIKLHVVTDYVEVDKALAYLAMWAMDVDRYAACSIMISGAEMTAVYRPEFDGDGPPAYVLGAVWNGETFGMHS